MAAKRPLVHSSGSFSELPDADTLRLTQLAVAEGAVTPDPGAPTWAWSTTENAPAYWTGTAWRITRVSSTLSLLTSEALTAGDLVSFWNDAGTAKVRKADSDALRSADGFVLSSYGSGVTATIFLEGENTAVSGLTVGWQFLSATSGGMSTTVPSAAGSLVQSVGFAMSATRLVFSRGLPVTLT
jgi:hypothetical protein